METIIFLTIIFIGFAMGYFAAVKKITIDLRKLESFLKWK